MLTSAQQNSTKEKKRKEIKRIYIVFLGVCVLWFLYLLI
jgi:hypothetical protein